MFFCFFVSLLRESVPFTGGSLVEIRVGWSRFDAVTDEPKSVQ